MKTPNLGRHLSNISDHRRPDARAMFCYSFRAISSPEGRNQEWQAYLSWINKNVIGPPKATDCYTRAQLEAMGMIGIYSPLDDTNSP